MTAANRNSASNADQDRIITAGEIFADGAMMELVSGRNKPELLLWDGSQATVGSRIKHGDRIYEPPQLTPSLYRALRLPSPCHDYPSARDLLAEIADLLKRLLDLPQRDCSLAAWFSVSSWLADRLPIAPSLVISGSDQDLGVDLLRLLSCVCRHSLILAELTPRSFRLLPMELSLTLLLLQQELNPSLNNLLVASSYPGVGLAGNKGNILDPCGPKVIFCRDDAAVKTLAVERSKSPFHYPKRGPPHWMRTPKNRLLKSFNRSF